MGITSNEELIKLRAEIHAEEQKLRSPEAIGAAVQQFAERTGYQGDNTLVNAQILRHLGDSAPTAENLEIAAQQALAANAPIDDLRRYLLDQEFLARGK